MRNTIYSDAANRLYAGEQINLVEEGLQPQQLRTAFSRLQKSLVALGFASARTLTIEEGIAKVVDPGAGQDKVGFVRQVARELFAGKIVEIPALSQKEYTQLRQYCSACGYTLYADVLSPRYRAEKKARRQFKVVGDSS